MAGNKYIDLNIFENKIKNSPVKNSKNVLDAIKEMKNGKSFDEVLASLNGREQQIFVYIRPHALKDVKDKVQELKQEKSNKTKKTSSSNKKKKEIEKEAEVLEHKEEDKKNENDISEDVN